MHPGFTESRCDGHFLLVVPGRSPELVPAPAEVDAAKMDHGLSAGYGPEHSGTFQPHVEQLLTRALHRSAPYRAALVAVLAVSNQSLMVL